MYEFSRRTFLTSSATTGLSVAALASLAACGNEEPEGSGTPKGGTTQWWESGQPQVSLDEKLVADNKNELGDVKVTFYNNTQIGEALQLAQQSNQMPDLTVINATQLGAPLASLVDDGWFQPLQLDAEATERLDAMGLLEGQHSFDGETYSFPVDTPGTNTVNWFHRELAEKAGIDPDNPPATYDEFRDACRSAVKAGTAGLIIPLKEPARNASQANFYAQAAGFSGLNGQLFHTGEFAFDAVEYVDYVEFLKSLDTDGLLVKGATTQDVKTAQGQWAAQRSVFYWDGPWIPGNIQLNFPELEGTVASGAMLVPEAGGSPDVYQPPPGSSYFIPATAEHTDVANKIMSLLTTDEYQVGWCNIMGKLPRDASAIDESDAWPLWKQVAKDLLSHTFQAPSPVTGAPDLVEVFAALKPAKPDLGTIIQGYFSGDVTDIKSALKKLSDDSNKALDDAIAQATSQGAKVSKDDFVFANWKPGADYTADMYDQR